MVCNAINEDTVKAVTSESADVFTVVEKMPSFPGGTDSLVKFLSTNLRYPKLAIDKGIEGRVYVEFIVNPDGTLSHINLKDGYDIGGGCGAEAIRVVSSMPRWSPGMQHGLAVPVSMILPVKFSLIENPYLFMEDTFNREDPTIDSLTLNFKWSVDKGETIQYRILISDIGHTGAQEELESLIRQSQEQMVDPEVAIEVYQQIQEARELIKYTVTIGRESDTDELFIKIEAITTEKPTVVEYDDKPNETILANKLVAGEEIKAIIQPDNRITGDLATDDQNIFSMLFELPHGDISMNDTWELKDVELMNIEESFVVDEYDDTNHVFLSDIRVDNGDTIGVVEYLVYTYLSGWESQEDRDKDTTNSTNLSHGSPKDQFSPRGYRKLYILSYFTGYAEFSLSQGKWISYSGMWYNVIKGIRNSATATNFSLIPE